MQPALNDPRFLAIRSLLVELAAALDADPRWELILAAVDRLADGPGRAEALQILFSDPYEPTWRRDGGPQLAGSPGCCGR
jgi:hypothetical protein